MTATADSVTGAARSAATFRTWAASAVSGTARRCHKAGDEFGAHLAEARAEVYEAAARLVEVGPAVAVEHLPQRELREMERDRRWLGAPNRDAALAIILMRHAMTCSVYSESGWLLSDWDRNGVRYVRARAWQLCAWELDPDLPEVQPRWD